MQQLWWDFMASGDPGEQDITSLTFLACISQQQIRGLGSNQTNKQDSQGETIPAAHTKICKMRWWWMLVVFVSAETLRHPSLGLIYSQGMLATGQGCHGDTPITSKNHRLLSSSSFSYRLQYSIRSSRSSNPWSGPSEKNRCSSDLFQGQGCRQKAVRYASCLMLPGLWFLWSWDIHQWIKPLGDRWDPPI